MDFYYLLFLKSCFFFSFFWAYFHFSCCPSSFSGGGIWPPEGIVFYILENEQLATDSSLLYSDNFHLKHCSNVGKITPRDFWLNPIPFGGDSQYLYKYSADTGVVLIGGGGVYDDIYLEWLLTEAPRVISVYRNGKLGSELLPWFDVMINAPFEYSIADPKIYDDRGMGFIPLPLEIIDNFRTNMANKFSVLEILYDGNSKLSSEFDKTFVSIINSSRGRPEMVNISLTLVDPGCLINPYSIPLANTILLLGSSIILWV